MKTTQEVATERMAEWRDKIKLIILSGGVVNFIRQEERDRTHIVPITRQNISFKEGIANVPSEMLFGVSNGNGAIHPDLDVFIDKLAVQKVVRELTKKGYNPVYIERILGV